MSDLPILTVLMPVYNGERYLHQSIESILSQTYSDFEFLIVDDGSTDSTPAILDEYAKKDERIRVITNVANKQLVETLNIGLEEAKGRHIARQDADDVAYPHRLEKQLEFLQKNSDVLVVGAAYDLIDETGANAGRIVPPLPDDEIKWQLFYACAFGHGFVMYRRDEVLAAGGYDCNYFLAEDHELWVRLALNGCFANLPVALGGYRKHEEAITSRLSDAHLKNSTLVCLEHMRNYLDQSPDYETGLSLRRLLGCDGSHGLTRSFKEIDYFVSLWESFRFLDVRYLSLFIKGLNQALLFETTINLEQHSRLKYLIHSVYRFHRSLPIKGRMEISDLLIQISGVLLRLNEKDLSAECRRLGLSAYPFNFRALKHFAAQLIKK
jgi:glycosyltransferase involved in cell wall biosynthesis